MSKLYHLLRHFSRLFALAFVILVGVWDMHGTIRKLTNVSNNHLLTTGKIALAHLTEIPDYYTRLLKMEKEAKKQTKK